VRIGLDARLAGRGLGIAQFITNLAAHLDPSLELVWFGDPGLAPRPLDAVRADRLPHPALDLAWGRRLARGAGLDVMHFTANTGWIDAGAPPFVLTVHDLMFMDTAVSGRSLRQVVGHRYARWNVTRALAAAGAVATPSAFSAAEIGARGSVEAVVVPNGVDLERRPGRNPPLGESERPYAIAFSARDPRKGVELAVAGWRAAGRVPAQLRLLAGAGMPPGLEQDIAQDVSEGRIVVLPYLDRGRLHELLAGAAALIYASHEEGFGLPVLEAMAAGTPVISGLAPATRELGGDAMLTIDAADPVDSIAAALKLIASEPRAAASLVAAGLRRVEGYSWRACADAYAELYREVASA